MNSTLFHSETPTMANDTAPAFQNGNLPQAHTTAAAATHVNSLQPIGHPGCYAIGNLAVELKLATQFDLKDASAICKYSGIPFGLGLMIVNCLTKQQLAVLLRAQSLLMDRLASEDEVLTATAVVLHDTRLTLQTALNRIKWVRRKRSSNTLGEILSSAKLITPLQFAKARRISNQSMLPTGKILTLTNVLSPSLVSAALDVQRGIRQNQLTREAGVLKLQSIASRFRDNLPQPIWGRPEDRKRPLLGELLVEAEILSVTDVICAVSMARNHQILVGEVLRELNWLSEKILLDALALQKLVNFRIITRFQAVRALKYVSTGYSLKDAVEKILFFVDADCRKMLFAQFTRRADLNDVDRYDLRMIEHCFVQHQLESDQAILLLNQCFLSTSSVEKVLSKLGWQIETDLRYCRRKIDQV